MKEVLTIRMTCPTCSKREDKECQKQLPASVVGTFLDIGWSCIEMDAPIAYVDGIIAMAKKEEVKVLVVEVGPTFDVWVPSVSHMLLDILLHGVHVSR